MNFRGRQGGDRGGSESLPDLLRAWRRRVDPRSVPGLVVSGRRSAGLTQHDVARLTGVSDRWYGALERGVRAGYSDGFLDRLAAVLRLNRAERRALYLKAVGRPPVLAAAPESDAAEMDGVLQQFLDSQGPNPAYATDLAWNIVGHNAPLRAWFPWATREANPMRWALLQEEAQEQLVNWVDDWVRPYLGQIRYERAQYPGSEALGQLERDVLASPVVREIWARRDVVEHADGDLRRLRLPYHHGQEVAVRVLALRPMRSDRLRVVVLMNADSGV
ncbi:helix-turn-helix transcriptional regulator [Streptomyces sp. NPDC059913]|uniref:helix-turn-helix transcriptional regulator n=1 Tax=unclassified Streptomyces TaxID=2593676 RepID=UPI003664CC27